MLRLDFSLADLSLPPQREKTLRASISGVQEKVQLSRRRGRFSLYESRQGDYILTPAYDLLNTALHFPNEPTATGLDFFADGHYTARYEILGFYSSADFRELATFYCVPPSEVDEMLAVFAARRGRVEAAVTASRLSPEAKGLYLDKFHDRLKALAQ